MSDPASGNGRSPSLTREDAGTPWTEGPTRAERERSGGGAGGTGPPGGAIFSLEDRPAAGLYFAAWLLSVGGFLVILVGAMAGPPVGGILGLLGLGALVLGLCAAASYQVLARMARARERYRGPSPVILFGVVVGVTILASVPLRVFGLLADFTAGALLVSLGLTVAAYFATISLFVVRTGSLSWREMGWPAGRSALTRAFAQAGVAAFIMLPATFVVAIYAGLLAVVLDVRAPERLPVARGFVDALLIVVAAVVVAPVAEEIFFRGFALTAWQRDLGPRSALVRSSILFAAVHILTLQASSGSEGLRQAALIFLTILPAGMLLGWLFQQRGIVAAIAGHMTYNGLIQLAAFLAASQALATG